MDETTLARLEHANLIEAIGMIGGQVDGAWVERTDGIAIVATGLPLRLFNQVLIDGEAVSSDAIAAAVAGHRRRGTTFVVNLRRGVDDRYLPIVAGLGLVRLSADPWMPAMALHPLPSTDAPAELTSGLEIRRVTDAAGVRDHIVAGAAGFEMPQAWFDAVVTEALLDDPRIALYVGYVDGSPVATGLGLRTDATIGVYNIATVPAARRRGYGATMTMRVIADGRADGGEVAILQASPMGYPIYERLGFRLVVEYDGYGDPEPSPSI